MMTVYAPCPINIHDADVMHKVLLAKKSPHSFCRSLSIWKALAGMSSKSSASLIGFF